MTSYLHFISRITILLQVFTICTFSQQMVTREINVSGETFQLPELGALVASNEDKTLSFIVIMPADRRQKAYREVDIQEADLLLMFNGKRVRSIPDLQKSYQEVEIGDEFKLGLQRKEKLFIASMLKMNPENAPQMQMRTMRVSPDGDQDMTIVGELGAILTQKDGDLTVRLMPIEDRSSLPDIQEADLLLSVNDNKVKTAEEFDKYFAAIAVGKEVKLGLQRDGEQIEIVFKKPEAPQNMMIRRRQQ